MSFRVRAAVATKRVVGANGVFPPLLYFLVILLWVSWIMSFLWFNAWLNLAISLTAFLLTWKLLRPTRGSGEYRLFGNTSKKMLLVLLLFIILVSAFNFIFFHDTFFGTRDEGLYANGAVYLSEHAELPARPAEGMNTRHFLNTVWFAEMHGLARFPGMKLANLIPLSFALLCVFLFVNDRVKSEWGGMMAVAIIAVSYPFVWFTRRTCNEILFFSLFWIAVYFSYRCFKSEEISLFDCAIALLSFSLLAFIRLEGIVVTVLAAFAGGYFLIKTLRRNDRRVLQLAVVILLLLVTLASVGIGLKQFSGFLTRGYEEISTVKTGRITGINENSLLFHEPEYTALSMIVFGFMPALLFILPFFYFLFRDRETRVFSLFLLALFLPFAYFFLRPNIAYDFPWFLRRYIAVSIPLAVIAFCVVVFKLKRTQALVISILFLMSTVFITAPIFLQREYHGMVVEVGRIASLLPQDSKVLVDRYTAGDYVIDYPLYFIFGMDVQRVRWDQKLDEEEFVEYDDVYLVSNSKFYYDYFKEGKQLFESGDTVESAEVIATYDLEYKYLEPTCAFHRGKGALFCKTIDYRVALSRIKVPTVFVTRSYEIIVARIELSHPEE